MSRWRCRPYRALLVDGAEGSLIDWQERRLDEHLRTCAACRDELVALREIPDLLRTAVVPELHEDFWRQQRQAIGRAIRDVPAPGRRWDVGWLQSARRPQLWRYPIAVAAALLVALGIYRVATDRQPQRPNGTERQLAGLDTDALAMLHDVMQALGPADDQAVTVESDDGAVLAAAPLSNFGAVIDVPPVLQTSDLSDNELEGLDTLVGDEFS